MVVFGQDVMDEITLSAKTTVCEIRNGKQRNTKLILKIMDLKSVVKMI